jgi:hypothetical protein
VRFCDESCDQFDDLDWDEFKARAQPFLYSACCGGDVGWGTTNDAVLALRRAVLLAERAEELRWAERAPHLVLVSDTTNTESKEL